MEVNLSLRVVPIQDSATVKVVKVVKVVKIITVKSTSAQSCFEHVRYAF